MLQLFAEEPLTTKQVADRLGEKPTRLYNHARALEQAGLIRLVRTRQNRGTTERYLEAVGSQFEVDERLFALGSAGSAAREATYATAAAILRNAAGELARLGSRLEGSGTTRGAGLVLPDLEPIPAAPAQGACMDGGDPRRPAASHPGAAKRQPRRVDRRGAHRGPASGAASTSLRAG